MDKVTWRVTLVLFSVIWLFIAAINVLSPEATQVPLRIVQEAKDAALISQVEIRADEMVIRLNQVVNIRLEVGQIRTQVISTARNDSTIKLEKDLVREGIGEIRLERTAPKRRGEWIFGVLLTGGIILLIIKAKRDRKNGSIRQQMADLKGSLDRGEIGNEEYTQKMNDLSPYL